MPSVFPRRGICRLAFLAAMFQWFPAAAQAPGEPAVQRDEAMPDGALDPGSPLAPLPDLGVDWPDLSAPVSVPLPADITKTAPAAAHRATNAAAEQRYHFAIEGLDDLEGVSPEKIRNAFAEISTLKTGAGKPANVAQIDRRAREDEGALRDVLRGYGYYDADVRARVETAHGEVVVTLAAEPGALYRFSAVDLNGLAEAGEKAATLRKAFPVQAGDPVDAAKIAAAEANLKQQLGHEGFAFAKVGETQVTVDHETHLATLTLAVDPDGAKRFGAIRISGKPLFGRRHLGRIARFHPGDPYDATLIDDFRRALIQTGLVSSVRLTPIEGKAPGTVDIDVRLEPAPKRTIAGELGYGTGEGVRSEISWTHRNLIRPEGAVTFRGVLGTQEQLLSAQLRRNNYKARDRVLTAQIAASHTNVAAYDARTFTLAGGMERQSNIIWQKKWTWSAGTELLVSDERDVIRDTGEPRRRTYYVAALPGSLAYDGSDDLLNPTRGFRLSARLSPELSFQGSAFTYARAQIDASGYYPVSGRTTIAGRVRVGSIFGADRDRIAPSRRFYAGGGGSVRGYGYQRIGPRDANNDPIGGQSLAEFSIEARVRFGDFGIVPFFDGGNLYTTTLPRFTGLRYGAGIGARYYTSFGPIRVDVGTPINPRAGDAKVAVYVSLGQAF
ncbi:MAG TPA: BamA/TamA family outer membrane protein [Sphingomonadaceae bacterium]|nr:BamA/TamA family outer membrane protein [Sphingomonadaceae bacterium]